MLQTINASHHVCNHTDPTHYSSFWWPEKKFGQFFTSTSSPFSLNLSTSQALKLSSSQPWTWTMGTENQTTRFAISTPKRWLWGFVHCAWLRGFSSWLREKVTIEALRASLTESHPLLFQRSLLSAISSIGSQITWIKKLPPAKKVTFFLLCSW